ncbi:MAG: hypothetical protein H7138_09795 [Myxococcales bacterium]|nr:hypothetical protein [Myxococcales bacterium]
MFRQDYLMRMIDQLALFVAHVTGLNNRAEHDKALAAADQAWSKLLDAPLALIHAMDTPTLAAMLREPDRIRAAATLLCEEGRALTGKGDPLHAALRYRRAMELVLEARAIAPGSEDDAVLFELSRLVPSDTMDPRYRVR